MKTLPICKKCGHQRTANDDPAIPDYQCPACGIIYKKYGQPVHYTKKVKSYSKAQSEFKKSPILVWLEKLIFFAIRLFIKIGNYSLNRLIKRPILWGLLILVLLLFIQIQQTPQPADETVTQLKKVTINCNDQPDCIFEKKHELSAIRCRRQIEKLSQYQYRWTDSIFSGKKDFSIYQWKNDQHKSIVAIGDTLELQNMFGSWQIYSYLCEINAKTGRIINVEAKPGRLQ